MTNEEKELLVAYLADARELDPDGDMEAQFMDWRRVREETVSGETHYNALLQAARVMARSFEEGRRAGLAEGAATLGWDQIPGELRCGDPGLPAGYRGGRGTGSAGGGRIARGGAGDGAVRTFGPHRQDWSGCSGVLVLCSIQRV